MKKFILFLAALLIAGCGILPDWIEKEYIEDKSAVIILDPSHSSAGIIEKLHPGFWEQDTIKFNYIPLAMLSGDTVFNIPAKYLRPTGLDTTGFNYVYNWIRPNGEKGTKQINEIRQFIIYKRKIEHKLINVTD